MKKASFIIHGKRKKKDQLINELKQKLGNDLELSFFITEAQGHAKQLAEQAVNKGCDFLIAAGGDGLLNEVVNGYMAADKNLRSKTIVGTFPFGTGNDFSKTIGIQSDLNQLVELIRNNAYKPVDVGLMQFLDTEKKEASRYFINISDIGIGGYVSMRVNRSSKILGSDLSYMKAIVLSFLTYRHRKIKLTCDSFEWAGPILLVIMANGKFFGSGMCVAPQAEVDDGQMQLVLLGNVSLLDYIKNLSKVRKGEIIEHPEVIYQKVTTCKIEPLEECTIDMDGEFIGYGPIEASILPGAIKFLRN